MGYFWCTDHKAVEGEHGCRAEVRLGPYPSQQAAEHAVESVHERNERLDEQDKAWEEG